MNNWQFKVYNSMNELIGEFDSVTAATRLAERYPEEATRISGKDELLDEPLDDASLRFNQIELK